MLSYWGICIICFSFLEKKMKDLFIFWMNYSV